MTTYGSLDPVANGEFVGDTRVHRMPAVA